MDYSNNMKQYINNISDRLAGFVLQVEQEGKNNLHDTKVLAENFYAEYLNVLYGWDLKNANIPRSNEPGIDLCYDAGDIIVQVSSDDSYKKIQESLKKIEKSNHPSGRFCFVAIKAAAQKHTKAFTTPMGVSFDPGSDIFDNAKLIGEASRYGIDKLKELSALMDKYFGSGEKITKGEYLTAPPAFADTNSVICRETELEAITKMLSEGKNNLLMNGFGGIGKTSLARLVFHMVRENYDEVAWIPYHGNLKESMLSHMQLGNYRNPEELWMAIQDLKNNGKSKLFVIDNADKNEAANQLPRKDGDLSALTGWPHTAVIVTSRQNAFSPFIAYDVGFLDEDNCVALFYSYYEHPKNEEDEQVIRNLIRLAKCHTFTVELLAKGANYEADLTEYYQDLRNEGFSFPDIEVEAAHNDNTTTIAGHLKILFDRKSRTDEQMNLLWNFALFPSDASLTIKEIRAWIGVGGNVCQQLVNDGWLSNNEGRYSMHPLVREILFLESIPQYAADEFLSMLVDQKKNYFLENEIYEEKIRKLNYAESVISAVCSGNASLQYGSIYHNIGEAFRLIGQYKKAKEYLEKALQNDSAFLHADNLNTATTYNSLGLVCQNMGELSMALEYHMMAKKVREAILGEDHPDTATTYNNIAIVYSAMGDHDKALEYHEKAKVIRENKLGKDHPDTANSYNNLACVFCTKGNFDKALEYHEKAKDICESQIGIDHPDTAATYAGIAEVYFAKGNYDEALELYEKAIAIREAKLGEDHPDTASTYDSIANIYHVRGNYNKALEFYEKVLAIRKVILGEDHQCIATSYNNIAAVHNDMRNLDIAISFYEKALAIREVKLGKDHIDTAMTYNNIAEVYRAKGNYDKAMEFHEKAMVIYEAKLGEDHPRTATSYNNIGLIYYAMGDCSRALAYFEKSKIIREAKLGEDHPDTANTYYNIGALYYYEKKEYATSTSYFLRALRTFIQKFGFGNQHTINTLNLLCACRYAEGTALETFIPWLLGRLGEEERERLLAYLQEEHE